MPMVLCTRVLELCILSTAFYRPMHDILLAGHMILSCTLPLLFALQA